MTRADYDLAKDYFALLDLPRRQHLDREDLERRYHEVQAQVHPDKHAHLSDQQKRLAMQWATRANEAYLTLKSPLKRAHYLLQLAGHDPQIERNTVTLQIADAPGARHATVYLLDAATGATLMQTDQVPMSIPL